MTDEAHPDPATAAGSRLAEASRPGRLAINFAVLTAGELTAKLLTFGAFSYLARHLGLGNYGLLEFTLALMVFFTLPADLGLGAYGAREIARNRDDAPKLLREIVQLRLLLAACSFALLLVFVLLIHKSLELKLLLSLYGLSLLVSAFMLPWFFQAHDQMHWVALASITRQLVFAALVFLCVRAGSSIVWVGVFECASVSAVAVFSGWVTNRKMGYALPRSGANFALLTRHLRQAFAIGLTELAWAFMWYFATVLLGFAFNHQALGWFGASHRLLMALHTFVWLYFFNLLPSVSRCVSGPTEQLEGLMGRSIRFAAWISLGVAFMGTLLSREILTLVYGPEFAGGGSSFSVLVWMLPVAMLSGHYRYTLLAYNLQNRLLYCTLASAGLAVAAGFAFVPLFGATGAAWALLVANVVNFALVYDSVRRKVAVIHFHHHLYEPLAAMAGAAVIFVLFERAGVWAASVIAGAAYLAVLTRAQGGEALALLRGVLARHGDPVEESVAG